MKLEQFEKPDDGTHEEVIDRIKEAINKLEDGLNNETVGSPKIEPNEEILTSLGIKLEPEVEVKEELEQTETTEMKVKSKKPKVKKGKKLRLLREKKVKSQVAKVKSELAMVRKQMTEMRQQMLKGERNRPMPESFLLPSEWCCHWVNGQPVGAVSEVEHEPRGDPGAPAPLPRRSVQVHMHDRT